MRYDQAPSTLSADCFITGLQRATLIQSCPSGMFSAYSDSRTDTTAFAVQFTFFGYQPLIFHRERSGETCSISSRVTAPNRSTSVLNSASAVHCLRYDTRLATREGAEPRSAPGGTLPRQHPCSILARWELGSCRVRRPGLWQLQTVRRLAKNA